MALTRKPFAEFAAELAAGLRDGRNDRPIAETARLKILEVASGDWRLSMVLDGVTEVIGDESFDSREEAIATTIDRLVACPDDIRTVPILNRD